jgi:MFS family permease
VFGRVLRDAFPLKRGEWGLGLFLYGLLTLMVAADWVGKLGADSLFVKRWGVNYVPVMYIVTPIAMLAVSAMIFFFVDRVRRRTLLLWYVAGVTLLSIAIQAGVTFQGELENGWIVQPVSYVFAHGVKETIYILFWVYAGNLYDAEQSKRLFPFFAGSVLVGKILGGAIGTGIAPLIHAENFIGAQAVGFMVCFVALVIYRGLPEGHGSRLEEKRPKGLAANLKDSVDGYRAVASDKMLRTFGVGVFFWYFLMQFGNFLYLVGLDQSTAGSGTGSEDLFSQLYASVYTSSSLVALFIQSVLTSVLLRRFGIARVLFVLPLWYLATFVAAAWPGVGLTLVTGYAIQLG